MHFIAYFIYNSIIIYFYLSQNSEVLVKYGFISFSGEVPFFINNFSGIPLAISGAFYAFLSLFELYKYNKQLPQIYSFIEKINLKWLKWLTIASILFFIFVFFIIQYGTSLHIIKFNQVFLLVSFALTIYLFIVGYFGLKQTAIFTDFSILNLNNSYIKPTTKGGNSSINKNLSQEILHNLTQDMQNNRPYLNENLTLPILARQINCTPNQLSQVINKELKLNFYNYINSFRVELVKIKLKDNSYNQYTILGIALDCGFRSKASFNKIFKKMVGLTPSVYKNS